MSDLYVRANTNTLLPMGNNGRRELEGTRDGAAFVAREALKWALQGRLFVANVGTVTTPVTFLITAANRPDFVIRVPTGTTVIPLVFETVLEAAAGTATELDVRMCQNDIGNGTSSAADVGPINLRTDVPVTSACTVRKLYTADATTETNPVSLHRVTWPLAQASGLKEYTDYWRPEPGLGGILIGPASFEAFLAATTTQATGYMQCVWAEVPTAYVQG